MSLLVVLVLLWAIIHIANYLIHRQKAEALLPISRGSHSLARRRDNLWDSRTTQIILKNLHLRVQTSAWNAKHDVLTKTVSARAGSRLRTALTYFYNAGCLMGVLGTMLALGLLTWNCLQGIVPLLHTTLAPSASMPLLRRDLEVGDKTVVASGGVGIKPIIPGWTVPLNHLPVIFLAVFVSQIVHELGHAVSAALDAVPILSAGASFTVVIPAAFVSFSSSALEALRPFARSRIIAAGPFHNLVFWGLLTLVEFSGTGEVLTRTLYRDVSDIGRVIIGMDGDSALRGHLPVGSLITKLDDTPLASKDDMWTTYLTSPDNPSSGMGWCVSRATYTASPQGCCEPHVSSPFSCFAAVSSAEKGCLDAIAILTNEPAQRCSSDTNCDDASQCVRPHKSAQILRLTVYDRVVIWSGPPIEVYEQVEIGRFLPRFRLVPLWVYLLVRLFWSYLKMATLSLYLFNLLPLPHLDGSQFVGALLDIVLQTDTGFDGYDLEALEEASSSHTGTQRRRRTQWKEMLDKGIQIATTSVFVLSAALTMVNIR
ncbi:histone acetyltransferase [Favolaschia claudopus]|uniref:Endopeptidase S2P n=1 Tax=Favolaschia claudopus TaxID=2862362 RepID=A0AAW0DLW5_9AGAR